jgi:Flp pilus assembly protein TadD
VDDKWRFDFTVPEPPTGKRVTASEAEVLLQSRLREKREEFENAIWQLARFYSSTRQRDEAARYITFLMWLTDDLERQAAYWLALGQSMERVDDFEEAVSNYRRALSMEPTDADTWYFINNNLGYSLIQLGAYDEAEPFCRSAIQIAPQRHNAYKNLGLALQGQGKFSDAAKSFMRAVQANASDPRALNHLEALVEQHPDLTSLDSELAAFLDRSREAVACATRLVTEAINRQHEGSSELTHIEKMLIGVHRTVFLEGRSQFSTDCIRRALGLSVEEWRSGYAAIFQAMREDDSGGAPQLSTKYRGVFRQVRRNVYTLTPYGHQLVVQIHRPNQSV